MNTKTNTVLSCMVDVFVHVSLIKFPTHIIHSTGDCHHRISAPEADEPERTIKIQREHEPMQVGSNRNPEFHTEHAWRTVSRNP